MRGWRAVWPAGVCLLLAACATAPVERMASSALADTGGTRLGLAVGAMAEPGRSGVHLLGDPFGAFATLLALVENADRSLDLQYYTWHDDKTGRLLLDAVWRAAERGVRVRLLLDDLHSKQLEWALATLDAHPAIEVRLFNPFANRYLRLVDFLFDFVGSNRRMHNKSFTADNQVTVIGGRNVGDAYFVPGAKGSFVDLDLLVTGLAVAEVSRQFDLYWNSPLAVPAAARVRPWRPDAGRLAATLAAHAAEPASLAYLASLDPNVIADPFFGIDLVWAPARVLFDHPEKIAKRGFRAELSMIPPLRVAMGVPERRLDIITAYFVVGRLWTELLGEWAARGVDLRVLTNTLATIDVPIAHAGYAARRRALLANGVRLWEMKPDTPRRRLDAPERAPDELWLTTGGTQHAKAAAIDGERVFVGSFNLDLRSAYLNSEMGIVVESPVLARALHRLFDETIDTHAFEVTKGEAGGLVWNERTPTGVIHHTREPDAGPWRALVVALGLLLPIDWLL